MILCDREIAKTAITKIPKHQRLTFNTYNEKNHFLERLLLRFIILLSYLVLPFFMGYAVAKTHASKVHTGIKRYPGIGTEHVQNFVHKFS